MKSLIEKDKKRRKLFKKYESKRRELKAIIYNKENSMELRNKAQIALSKLPKDSSKIRIKNRCVLTGRSKGVFRYFKLSRIQLRQLTLEGNIPGYSKTSW
jgi:small subunit ribosomal protein S14|tara:strand:+ start:708 stop:1007 length:300 start_codon:yes stop_codon:yes gene_type:complete